MTCRIARDYQRLRDAARSARSAQILQNELLVAAQPGIEPRGQQIGSLRSHERTARSTPRSSRICCAKPVGSTQLFRTERPFGRRYSSRRAESRALDLLRAIEKNCIISRTITAPVEIVPTIRGQSWMQPRLAGHLHLRSIMYRVCIVLVDATRARLFTLDRVDDGAETHEELVERTDLVNPQRRRRPSELFADTRPGSSRVGQLQYAFDDHRDHHISQLDEKFARAVMATLRELIDERPTQRVIVCASPRMLGKLRASAPGILPHDLTFDEVPRDLVKLSPADVRAGLARQGLLPPSTTSSAQRTMGR